MVSPERQKPRPRYFQAAVYAVSGTMVAWWGTEALWESSHLGGFTVLRDILPLPTAGLLFTLGLIHWKGESGPFARRSLILCFGVLGLTGAIGALAARNLGIDDHQWAGALVLGVCMLGVSIYGWMRLQKASPTQ